MIPILYESTETAFTSNGLGRLGECISCEVTEERNGVYECEFRYPITGKRYADIIEGRYISCTHDDTRTRQPFEIYGRSAPINGVVTFYAHHISYKLNNIILNPLTATSASDAFAQISGKSINANPFEFWTDVYTSGNFNLEAPSSVRGILGGVRGSILDVYGGEYEFDEFTVKLHANRGANTGVTIRYGKNLLDITQEIDNGSTYNAVVPFWRQEDTVVMLDERVVRKDSNSDKIVVLDLSNSFQEQPTQAQLRSAAQSYLNRNRPWIPNENIKIDFVALWQTTQYKDVAVLQRVKLCDTVNVYYPALGVVAEGVKVIKTVYDSKLDRYSRIELGEAKSSFAETIMKETEDQLETLQKSMITPSMMQKAIDHATQLITGGLGGHVVFKLNADGEPEEILVMDTDDVQTAVNVIRINMGGIGFSTNGYNGPFTTAWTIDGHFNADFITTGALDANLITTGTLNADLIRAGRIADKNNISYWDLDTGLMNFVGNMVMSYTYGNNTYQARFGLVEWQSGTPQPCFRLLLDDTREMDFYIGTSGYAERLNYSGTPTNFSYSRNLKLRASSTDYRFTETIADKYQISMSKGASASSLFKFILSGNEVTWMSAKASTWYPRFSATDTMINWETSETNGANFLIRQDTKTVSIQAYYGTSFGISTSSFTISTGGTSVLSYSTNTDLISRGRYIAFQSTSSKRYKHDIKPVEDSALDPHRLYDLEVKQFRYHDGMVLQYDDMANRNHVGFIAEEVDEIYPDAVIHHDGQVESWDERRIIPPMLKLIQEQKQKIDELEARITRLERAVNLLMEE